MDGLPDALLPFSPKLDPQQTVAEGNNPPDTSHTLFATASKLSPPKSATNGSPDHRINHKSQLIFSRRTHGSPAKPASKQKRARSPWIQLTNRDYELLDALAGSRYMNTFQIQRLFFGGNAEDISRVKACQRRLRKLVRYGLIRRILLPVKRGEGSKPYIYALDKKGAEELAALLHLNPRDISWKRKPAEENERFLRHLMDANDIRISTRLACTANHLELSLWMDDNELRREGLDQVTITGPNEKQEQATVIPDIFCIIRNGAKTMQFFWEVDESTVPVRSVRWNRGWKKKSLTYVAYFASAAYQKRFGSKRVRLLTVTTNESHLATMKEATEEAGGRNLFWFALQNEAKDPTKLFNEKIWRVAGESKRFSIL